MNEYSLLNVFQEIYRWKKHIIITILIIGAVTATILLFTPNYYKASTTFYPASPTLANPEALGYDENIKYVYGGGDDSDRLFSILNSENVMNHLILKFDLYKSYKIDSSKIQGKHLMMMKLKANYENKRTKYDAIELTVEDKDPEVAAKIANEARDYANLLIQKIIKETQFKSIESLEKNILLQEEKVSKLADTIQIVKSNSKMIDPYFQSETFSAEVIKAESNLADAKAKADYYNKFESKKDSTIKYRAIAIGLESKVAQLRTRLATFYEVGPWLKKKEMEYSRSADQLSIEKEKMSQMLSSYNNAFTGLHVIDKAIPPYNKSGPKRTLIVFGAMLLAAVTSILGILLLNSIKQRK